jgi:nucleotide-binding universal stress UspA family protein
MRLDRILVPLDGSALAETGLDAAVDMARLHPGATIVLMRAADARALPGTDPRVRQESLLLEAEAYLGQLASRLSDKGMEHVETSVWYGPAGPAIVDAAESGKADLIVMSSHGRSGLGRLVFGCVAEDVLRGTRIPILIVREPGAPVIRPLGAVEVRTTTGALREGYRC